MFVICAGGTKLEWRRHDKADSIAKALFGHVKVTDLEIQGSGEAGIHYRYLLPGIIYPGVTKYRSLCVVRLSTS